MRTLLLVAVGLAPSVAVACPACASAQRSGPSAWLLVLVVLPFVIVGLAARAIRAAIADDGSSDGTGRG